MINLGVNIDILLNQDFQSSATVLESINRVKCNVAKADPSPGLAKCSIEVHNNLQFQLGPANHVKNSKNNCSLQREVMYDHCFPSSNKNVIHDSRGSHCHESQDPQIFADLGDPNN